MRRDFSIAELEAYLDEVLSTERMAAVEAALREDASLQERLAAISGRRDAGVHSLGDIWRRHRISCPSREELGSYLLGVLANEAADYVAFHVETIGCRYCSANVEDLRARQSASDSDHAERRRHRYFHSSAGYLHTHD